MFKKLSLFALTLFPLAAYDVYITNITGGNVIKVTASGEIITPSSVVTSINPGNIWTNTDGIAISPDGQSYYVLDDNASTVSIVRISDNTLVTTTNITSPSPGAIAFSPNGQSYYIPNENQSPRPGELDIFSINTNTLINTVPFPNGSSFGGIAFSPDGTSYYLTDQFNEVIYIVSIASNTITHTVTLPLNAQPAGIAFSLDGTSYYVTDSANQVIYIFSTPSNALLKTVSGIFEPSAELFGIAFSPDGNYYYVTDVHNSVIYTLSTATNTLAESAFNPGSALTGPFSIAVYPSPISFSKPRPFQRAYLHTR